MPHPRHRAVSALLLSALCLMASGCTLPTTVTKFQKLATPTELRECAAEPAFIRQDGR
jgi:hypothetical protein